MEKLAYLLVVTPVSQSSARKALVIYVVISVFACMLAGGFALWRGPVAALLTLVQKGPYTDLVVTYLSLGIMWGLVGAAIVLWDRDKLHKGNLFFYCALLAYSFLYLNILRERDGFGDVGEYWLAAGNLLDGKPYHPRYLYPPLWSMVLSPLIPLGITAFVAFCHAITALSSIVLFALLQKCLRRFGFADHFATLVSFLALSINAATLRNMGYVQVNVLVLDFVLLSLLLAIRYPVISAICLALAANLKIAPALLALPFLLALQWRWLISFALAVVVLCAVPYALYGELPFVSFASNLGNAYTANPLSFRDNSVDSFIRASLWIIHGQLTPESNRLAAAIATPIRAMIVGMGLWGMARAIKTKVFYVGERSEEIVYNGVAALMMLMVAVAPLIWVHHLIFVVLPVLLLLKRIRASDALLYGIMYFALFLIPTFDFYILSYHRLAGIMLFYVLLFRRSARVEEETSQRSFGGGLELRL